ncbi:hypothetical protein SAMD00019534_008050, partial [Acytostelium subglobosum LB1]|uniref:hypothetical protein n=1 Tax=Acytostelium subglobosum LB1 TaxID=1410327 RepID=UPI000644DABE
MPLFDTFYHTYKHNWSDISLASWRKYPSPDNPDVLSVDMISKELDPITGVLTCRRLVICKSSTPAWMQSIFGASECFFIEESTVDPKTQTMTLRTKNLSFTNIMGVEEVCTYTPDPDNADWTQFKQEAKVTANVFGVASSIERFCIDRFKTNAQRGRNIMESAILKVKLEAEETVQSIDKLITTAKKEAEGSLLQIETILKAKETALEETLSELEKDLKGLKGGGSRLRYSYSHINNTK